MPGYWYTTRRRARHIRPGTGTANTVARSGLTITAATVANRRVLNLYGVLDGTTYQRVHAAISKAAALDNCQAVIVDVTRLSVAADAPWSQFTSACEHITEWPDIPLALVCDSVAGQKLLRHRGISRNIPVYWSVAAATAALTHTDKHARRRRADTELSAQMGWLQGWPTTPLGTAERPGRLSCVS